MKLVIELPDNWLDGNKLDDLTFITRTVREGVHKALTEAILNQVQLPDIGEFNVDEIRAEVKSKVVDRLVDSAIERLQ